MASNDNNDEKPNLRPTKRITAGGKSVFLHHNPRQPSNKSYIHAVWKNDNEKSADQKDPFGIDQPQVEYSLNKKQRWEILHDFHRNLPYQSSSSSDDELDVRSDSEQNGKNPRQKTKSVRQRFKNSQKTKYRLYELHNTEQQANCVSIASNTGPQRIQTPKKTYMQDQSSTAKLRNHPTAGVNAAGDNNRQLNTADVTYYAVVPPPREKQLVNIRRKHGTKAKRAVASTQRSKFTQVQGRMDIVEQLEDDNEQTTSDDGDDGDDEFITSTYTSQNPDKLQLTDFIPIVTTEDVIAVSTISENLVTVNKFDPKASRYYLDDIDGEKQAKKFHRQISREEKLYNRDKAVYLQTKNVPSKDNHHHGLMSLSFNPVLITKTSLTIDYLSKTYGKNFIHAQCYPTKYLICLTDRLKSYKWPNNFQLFPIYSVLNCYLVLVLNDEISSEENFTRVQVGFNMDLYAETIPLEFENSLATIYKINEIIERTIELITTLSFDTFKPIDAELSRRKIVKNDEDNELSDSEFLNKQIRRIRLLDKNPTQTETLIGNNQQLNNDVSTDDYELLKPDICTNCYRDMDETIPMTALKTCAHWLCDDCWRQYIENSIKRVGVVLCPEWNCCSLVDVGTMLSLANVRCVNIYERNLEKCLVNLSRSYVQCPAKSCSNIVQVIGSLGDNVRCRCGHRFCANCKQEAHFPATCSAYRIYMDEVFRNGDLISDYDAIVQVKGRNCVSCHSFIEKNGGCNHMTCSCGAQFCWTCTAYWKDHNATDGTFRCPKEAAPIQEEILAKHHSKSRRFYYNAISHRHQRIFQVQSKLNDNAKRLLGTIPLEKGTLLTSTHIKSQIDKRESVLRHLYEMVKYVEHIHRVCEFIAVAAEGYGNNPCEFHTALHPLEIIVFNMSQVLEGGRGYKAIEQIARLHESSEKIIERIRRAVTLRELRRTQPAAGYTTS
ncbi:unnamed protein product [Rotaria socialis]|uniref:RBR-type E3 ubiquitin transferase n=1 Tax=Rotaria socialis TaxID=392032 RepID=A0A820C626_9BILA|nr:unnamed protein product [Rotaria socialis]CAF4217148.1 unnamed protein product [Rotaria socialis]